jgi:hypothetical protein
LSLAKDKEETKWECPFNDLYGFPSLKSKSSGFSPTWTCSGASKFNFQTITDLSLDPDTNKGLLLASLPTVSAVTDPLWPI